MRSLCAFAAATLLVGGTARAQDAGLGVLSAWEALERIPPETSWELAAQFGYGDITYFRTNTTPWITMGMRGGWGRHLGERRLHRVGVTLGVSLEGPLPQYYTIALEPALAWDVVSHRVQVGASVGPAGLAHLELDQPAHLGGSPSAAVRFGYSEPWSRAGRRLFVLVEPKIRVIAGWPNLTAALVVGSGRGR